MTFPRPRSGQLVGRNAARLAVACLLFTLFAAAFAPTIATASAVFSHGLRGAADPEGVPAAQHAAQHASEIRTATTGDLDDLEGDAAASRHLLHGWMPFLWQYPLCPRGCKVVWCIGNWWFGHCRWGRKLYTCWRPKRFWPPWRPWLPWIFGRSTAGTARVVGSELPPRTLDPESLAPAPDPRPNPGFTQNVTASAPYVACVTEDDCALRAAGFAPANGSEPTAVDGVLSARCLRPDFVEDPSGLFADFPGICMCLYASFPREITDPGVDGEADPESVPERAVTSGFCMQMEDEAELDEEKRAARDHTVHPFFVPGSPPLTPRFRDSVSGPAPAPELPIFDGDREDITSGSIVGLSFVDGLPDDANGTADSSEVPRDPA